MIFAAILITLVALALYVPSTKGLTTPTQSPNIGRRATSMPAALEGVISSQTQGALQPQRSYFTVTYTSTTNFDAESSAFASSATYSTVGTSSLMTISNNLQGSSTLRPILNEVVDAINAKILIPPASQISQVAVTSQLTNELPTSTSVGIDSETTTRGVYSRYFESTQAFAEKASTTPSPSAIMSKLNAHSAKGLISGSETITANAKSQHIFYGQTLSLDSTEALGSSISTTLLALPTSDPQTSLLSSFSVSLSSRATATPELSKTPPLPSTSRQATTTDGLSHPNTNSESKYSVFSGQTPSFGTDHTRDYSASTTLLNLTTSGIPVSLVSNSNTSQSSRATATPDPSKTSSLQATSGQTTRADSLSQHNTHGQPLTPSTVVAVSGIIKSLATDASGILRGTSTEAFLGPFITAGFSPGRNATEVQTFKGSALASGHGLCSSSIMALVGMLLLLWF